MKVRTRIHFSLYFIFNNLSATIDNVIINTIDIIICIFSLVIPIILKINSNSKGTHEKNNIIGRVSRIMRSLLMGLRKYFVVNRAARTTLIMITNNRKAIGNISDEAIVFPFFYDLHIVVRKGIALQRIF